MNRKSEKNLMRALMLSVCSILVCMSCLVGTTWAWYTTTLTVPNNVIQLSEPGKVITTICPYNPQTKLVETDKPMAAIDITGQYQLNATFGYHLQINYTGLDTNDDLSAGPTLYVIICFVNPAADGMERYYIELNQENEYTCVIDELVFDCEKDVYVTFYPSWIKPADIEPQPTEGFLLVGTNWVEREETTEPTTEPPYDLSPAPPSDLSPAPPSDLSPSETEPTVTEPTVTEPTVTEPTVTEPTVTEPTVTEPTVTEPTVTEPTVTEPTVTEPTVTEPTVIEPTVTEPATEETEAPTSETQDLSGDEENTSA